MEGHILQKILPIDKIIEICNNQDKQVILVGGKEDFDRGERITLNVIMLLILVVILQFNQSAYIVKKSTFLITHDNGI